MVSSGMLRRVAPVRNDVSDGRNNSEFEVFTSVTIKKAVFWDVTPCVSCKNRLFGGVYRFRHQGDKNRRASNNVSSNQLLLLLTLFLDRRFLSP
jgi:hypothetical protein